MKTLKSTWSCPSNIALIKYWGKKPPQLPLNPSVSFSLDKARTQTSIQIQPSSGRTVEFLFQGNPSPFGTRVEKYLDALSQQEPWINDFSFTINSANTFPHSAGIASSASAYGALALCLTDLKNQLVDKKMAGIDFFSHSSQWARQGSGSACRSVFPQFVLWGKTEQFPESSDEYAIPVNHQFHPDFASLRDAILLVDSSAKKISSSSGHDLMNDHPYRDARIEQAKRHTNELIETMRSGNFERFFAIVENEALSLHAMMMTSNPSFILLYPNSLKIMEKVRDFRLQTGLPVGFTIDAGPNIHLLYFEFHKKEVQAFIQKELLEYTEKGGWLDDGIGKGPEKISS